MNRTWQTLIVVASAAAALAIGLGAQATSVDAEPAAVMAAR
jgi:hypothetical protein